MHSATSLAKPSNIPVVVLAGGHGTRMGGVEKCLLEVNGETILQRLITNFSRQSDEVLLNTNSDDIRFADYDIVRIADEGKIKEKSDEAGLGPLAGVLATINYINQNSTPARFLLSVAGDSPFLPEDLLTQLLDSTDSDTEVIYCHSAGRDHFVIALWSVSLAPRLREFLSSGRRSVGKFTESCRHKKLEFTSQHYDRFININTPEQLQQAQIIARELSNEKK